jgi:short-subunit dehydrogenase
VDIADRDEIRIMVQTILDLYGRVDILFNNAGFGRLAWLDNMSADRDIDTQIAVNLTGLIHMTHAVLPGMLKRRSGHIINMSSVAGWIAPPTYTIYSATKFGVRAFTDALRREVHPYGVDVSGIYPGPAKTEFGEHTGAHPLKLSTMSRFFPPLTSKQVAARVVELARNPRRTVIMPWYYRIAIWVERCIPWVVDWVTIAFLTKKRNKFKPNILQ